MLISSNCKGQVSNSWYVAITWLLPLLTATGLWAMRIRQLVFFFQEVYIIKLVLIGWYNSEKILHTYTISQIKLLYIDSPHLAKEHITVSVVGNATSDGYSIRTQVQPMKVVSILMTASKHPSISLWVKVNCLPFFQFLSAIYSVSVLHNELKRGNTWFPFWQEQHAAADQVYSTI